MSTILTPVHIDSRARRLRTRSQSTGVGFQKTPRLINLVDAIRRKGPLPTGLCFPLWRGDGEGGYSYFQRRMTAFFHEPQSGGPFLTRPDALNAAWGVKAEPAWYDLSPAGYALAYASRDYVFPPARGWMRHRAMGAVIAASFEIMAPSRGLRYIDKEEIAAAASFPAPTRSTGNPLQLPLGAGKIIPDDLFGLEYRLPEGRRGIRYFVREDDRGTETFNRSDRNQTSLRDKIERYCKLFETSPRPFARQWGISNLRVLFITTIPGRIELLLRFLDGKPHADRFLLKCLPMLGSCWRTPRAPIDDVFDDWRSVGGRFNIADL